MFLNNKYIINYYIRKQSLDEARRKFGTWLLKYDTKCKSVRFKDIKDDLYCRQCQVNPIHVELCITLELLSQDKSSTQSKNSTQNYSTEGFTQLHTGCPS